MSSVLIAVLCKGYLRLAEYVSAFPIDLGEVLRVFKTPVYLRDTLQTLARRHYENEIYILSNFHKYLKKVYYKNFKEKDAHMRMPLEKEKTLEEKFKKYKEKFCK